MPKAKYNTPFYTSINDDGKLYRRWINKHVNAKKESIECNLTYQEFCQLVHDAGLVSSQLGFKGEGYVLARYNDIGPYEYNNCRFIKQNENSQEKMAHMQFEHVYCIEDKKYFESARLAAEHYGISYSRMKNILLQKYSHASPENKTFIRIGNLTPSDKSWHETISTLSQIQKQHKQEKLHNTQPSRKPNKETLLQQISTLPMTHVAQIYKVSDKAVVKWCKSYGIYEQRLNIRPHKNT